MSKRITRTSRVAFAALVAAGLTFGAGAALASPAANAACPINPPAGQFGYTCSTVADCNAKCPDAFGNICSNGCCICAL